MTYDAEADGIMLRHGNFGVRFVHEGDEEDEYGDCFLLIDTRTGNVLGWDGGEPEDQLLVRDWKWVPNLLDEVERSAHAAGRREGIKEAVIAANRSGRHATASFADVTTAIRDLLDTPETKEPDRD